MGRVDADAGADLFEASRAGRILSAGHAGGQVVGDHNGDVRPFVDGVQQSRHARVGEGRVADDSHRGVLSCVGGAHGHRDRGAHVDARVDGVERGKPAQRVAADIAEYLSVGEFSHHFGQGGVHVAVSASLAQGGRTRHDDLTGGVCPMRSQPQGGPHAVGGQLARTRKFARQPAADLQRCGQYAPHGLLDEGLSLLDDKQFAALLGQPPHERLRQRILRNLQHGIGTSVGVVLHQVVVGDAAGDDAHPLARALRVAVEAARCGLLLQTFVVGDELLAAHARVAGHEHPLARLFGITQCIFGLRLSHLDDGPRVGHAGGHAHQYWNLVLFREVEGRADHVVGLLLGRGFERGDEGELPVEARVLFVLRGVHRGVVGHHDNQTAVGAGHARVDEGVGGDVQSDVFHADHGPFADERHAEGLLHGRLFVG